MKGKTLCIVIALMVLSIGAIIGAGERILTLGGFSSTLNGVPVEVMLSRQGSVTIPTMRARDLWTDWTDHVDKYVRVTGVVKNILTVIRGRNIGKVRLLMLEGDRPVDVRLLDAPNLPAEYHRGHKYEFTGFMMLYTSHSRSKLYGVQKMRLYAHEIRHLGEAEEDEDANPKDGVD